jgi:hypothetical protein
LAGGNFLRTPAPAGVCAKLPWLRELMIISDLDRRLDEVIGEMRPRILHAHSPALNALSAIRAGRRHRLPVVGQSYVTLLELLKGKSKIYVRDMS